MDTFNLGGLWKDTFILRSDAPVFRPSCATSVFLALLVVSYYLFVVSRYLQVSSQNAGYEGFHFQLRGAHGAALFINLAFWTLLFLFLKFYYSKNLIIYCN